MKTFDYIHLFFLFILLALATLLNSRAFIISVLIAMYVDIRLFYRSIFSLSKNLTFLSVIGMVSIALGGMHKVESTQGRMLIYKISFQMFKDNWLFGIQSFGGKYLLYQQRYFSLGGYTALDVRLADNTYFAFNDYWQLIIERGFSGILLFFLFFILAYLVIKGFKYDRCCPWLVRLSITSFIIVVSAAFFRYIFSIMECQIVLISSSLIIATYCCYKLPHKRFKYVIFFLLNISLIGSFLHQGHTSKSKLWTEAKQLWLAGYICESLSLYQKIEPEFQRNPDFLADYGNRNYIVGNISTAKTLIERAIVIKPSNILYLQLGDCYFKQKNFIYAERYYITAINTIPNRFVPRRALLNFYIKRKSIAKAQAVARGIVELPIKIHSPIVSEIKNEAKLFLKNINQPSI